MSVVYESQVQIWYELDNTIYTYVLSDGTSGENWINIMESSGVLVSNRARSFFKTKKFKISEDKKVDIEIIKGSDYKSKFDIIKVKRKAASREIGKALPEVVCLLQQQLSCNDFDEMCLKRIVIMHEAYEKKFLCLVVREGSLIIDMVSMYEPWQRTDGFAFSFKK